MQPPLHRRQPKLLPVCLVKTLGPTSKALWSFWGLLLCGVCFRDGSAVTRQAWGGGTGGQWAPETNGEWGGVIESLPPKRVSFMSVSTCAHESQATHPSIPQTVSLPVPSYFHSGILGFHSGILGLEIILSPLLHISEPEDSL